MLEKLALLKIARCSAPAFSSTSSACLRRVTSPVLSKTPILVESATFVMVSRSVLMPAPVDMGDPIARLPVQFWPASQGEPNLQSISGFQNVVA
jgi:hypothetical protein